MLHLLIPLAIILFVTSLWLIAMAEHERRAMLKRIGHMRALQEVERSFGDVVELHPEAKRTTAAVSAGGESSCLKQRPSYSLTGDIAHRKGGI